MSDFTISVQTVPILVIDSDRTFHAVAQAAGASLPGAKVVCCTTTGEALNRLDAVQPVLIILDGRLGGAGAINFVRRLRAGQTSVPDGILVMFVAQDFSGGLSGKLCDVGCHGIVRKPVSPEALNRAIMRIFESPRPFVLGGNYLGPDRRTAAGKTPHDPERRRTATRGGWAATHRLSTASLPLVTMTTSEDVPDIAEIAAAPPAAAKPKREAPIEPAEPAKKASSKTPDSSAPVETPPRPKRSEPVETPRARPAPAARENYDLAPAPAKPESAKAPEFDVMAVVELHRQWIATNGTAGARANLAGKPLQGAALGGQNLAKANLRGADLTNADLRQSILLDADLRDAMLGQALMDEAQLAGAKLRHADLQFAQLSQSGLQGSDLAGADLRGAILVGADFSGANLLGANLRGADLTGINLTQKQLDRALGDHTTRLPPGLFVGGSEAFDG